MRMPAAALSMTRGQRAVLEGLAKSRTAAHREVQRAQVLLLAADGVANTAIAESAGVSAATVRSWRRRFGAEGLADFGRVRPGRGRKPVISPSDVEEMVRRATTTRPPGGARWTVRAMAAASGISPAQVHRIWVAHGIAPHRADPTGHLAPAADGPAAGDAPARRR